jgi:transcriptional regulator with XRE-family HTH domain
MPKTEEERFFPTTAENRDLMLRWGKRLRWLRRRAGITQSELARRAGLESGDIRLLEGAHAEALVSVWLDIAAALKVSLAEVGEDPSSSRRPALSKVA